MVTSLQTFPKKLTFFTKFFADQCAPLNKLNKFPLLYLKTDKKFRNLSINENDISTIIRNLHCVKSAGIRSYSGPHFPAFGLNTERYKVSLRIQSECGKMRTRITPNTDTFHAVLDRNKSHG